MRDLRGRVKAARAILSSTPGLADTLARDWQKAAMFYARFGTTEGMFVYGVPGRLRTLGGFPPELPEEIFPEALRLRFGLPSVTGYRLC